MKVLIVDDNANDRKLLRLNLERHGCATVIEARDGLEGLKKAKELKPDLIISDALMPRMDGFEFLREVKRDEAINAIPFVFHSSVYTGSRDEELASRLGAEAFITKPKEPEEFWKEIASILDGLATGAKKLPPLGLMEEEQEFLREYSGVVTAKLEEKLRELEESLKRREEAEEALSERVILAELSADMPRPWSGTSMWLLHGSGPSMPLKMPWSCRPAQECTRLLTLPTGGCRSVD
jgi:CheY-like chemotaxis protein